MLDQPELEDPNMMVIDTCTKPAPKSFEPTEEQLRMMEENRAKALARKRQRDLEKAEEEMMEGDIYS